MRTVIHQDAFPVLVCQLVVIVFQINNALLTQNKGLQFFSLFVQRSSTREQNLGLSTKHI